MIRYNNPNENWRKRQNYYDRREKESGEVIKQIVKTLLVCLAFALLGWLLSGCTTTKYVPVIETHTDTLIHTVHHRDSIYMHDSIRVSEKGDTVKIERWHTQYRDRWRHDTIYQARHDTVPQPYPVTEYIEKPLSKFDWLLRIMGTVAIVLIMMRIAKVLRNTLP